MKTYPNDSAFISSKALRVTESSRVENQTFGLTKREYFAVMIMQKMATKTGDYDCLRNDALIALKAADALIHELNKQSA